MIAQETLIELFEYREGDLYRKKSIAGWPAGIKIGSLHKSGYVSVRLAGSHYQLHRLVFLYHHGFLPKYVDHINGEISDNRIENLREATVEGNTRNAKVKKTNRLGVKGVRQLISGTFEARIRAHGQRITLGYFDTLEEAREAYNTKAIEVFGEFARIA